MARPCLRLGSSVLQSRPASVPEFAASFPPQPHFNNFPETALVSAQNYWFRLRAALRLAANAPAPATRARMTVGSSGESSQPVWARRGRAMANIRVKAKASAVFFMFIVSSDWCSSCLLGKSWGPYLVSQNCARPGILYGRVPRLLVPFAVGVDGSPATIGVITGAATPINSCTVSPV